MSQIDDPVEAALSQIQHEQEEDAGILGPVNSYKRTSTTLARTVFDLLTSPSPLGALASAGVRLSAAWGEDRAARTHEQQIYVVDAVIEKLKVHDSEIVAIKADANRAKEFAVRLSDILDDTLSVSVARASTEKLDHFASIAASGALVFRADPIEQTQEFLRITAQLIPTDVFVFRELASAQNGFKQWPGQMEVWLHEIQTSWKPLLERLRDHGVSDMSYRSAFVRLQALGLIERTQPNMSTNAPTDVPYALLELGKLYLAYLVLQTPPPA